MPRRRRRTATSTRTWLQPAMAGPRTSTSREASAVSFSLFKTAIGPCAIAWSDRGVTSVWLPERTLDQTRARVIRRFPLALQSAPPPVIAHAIESIVALLAGESRDLTDIPLDFDDRVPEFHHASTTWHARSSRE